MFTRPSLLLSALDDGEVFNAYILEIALPELNGIDLADRLRCNGSDAPVIFLTNSRAHALEAYGVLAVRYLLKPATQEALYEALDIALLLYGRRRRERYYFIKTSRGIIRANTGDIVCVENMSRAPHFSLRDGECITSVCLRGSFEEQLIGLISDPSFVSPHKSYLVNMKYIQLLSGDTLRLTTGRCIPISRRNAAETRKRYLKYLDHTNGRGYL